MGAAALAVQNTARKVSCGPEGRDQLSPSTLAFAGITRKASNPLVAEPGIGCRPSISASRSLRRASSHQYLIDTNSSAKVIVRPTLRPTGPLSITKAWAACLSPAPGTANAITPVTVSQSVADQTE